jgi:uncharacterized protein
MRVENVNWRQVCSVLNRRFRTLVLIISICLSAQACFQIAFQLTSWGALPAVAAEGKDDSGNVLWRDDASSVSKGAEKGSARAATEASEEALFNKVFDAVSKFLKESYPKAKITGVGNKIHFEYKSRPNLNSLTGKTDTIPDFGGVIGDLEFKPGEYCGGVPLPQKYAEYAYYSVILMAPYAQSSNLHIYTRLAYPSDATQEFTDQFQSLMNSFADGTSPKKLGKKERETASPEFKPEFEPSNLQKFPEKEPPVVLQSERKLSFWKSTKGSSIVYILPLINFGKNRYYPITGQIGKSFKVSSQIAVDSYMGLPSDPYSIGCYGGDDRLSNHISAPTKKSLEDLVAWSGEPFEIYDMWKPYFLTTGFDSSLIRQIGFNILNIEQLILKETRYYGKRLVELEPAVNRLKYFESLTESDQDLCARLALYDILDYESQQRKLEDAWLAGDATRTLDAVMSSTRSHPELLKAYTKLYQDCNNPLADAVEAAFKKAGPIFVSLDVRRVYGEQGLLKLLEQRGFKLNQETGLMLTLEPGVLTELPYIEGDEGEVKIPAPR